MDNVTGFVSSLFLSIALAIVVALILRRPLSGLLVELCGNARRARFWSAFSTVALVLGALLGALFSIPESGEAAWEDAAGVRALLLGLRSSTFLLLAVISAMGYVMLKGISRAGAPKSSSSDG